MNVYFWLSLLWPISPEKASYKKAFLLDIPLGIWEQPKLLRSKKKIWHWSDQREFSVLMPCAWSNCRNVNNITVFINIRAGYGRWWCNTGSCETFMSLERRFLLVPILRLMNNFKWLGSCKIKLTIQIVISTCSWKKL